MSRRMRNVFFVLIGVAGLVLEGRYSGPAEELVYSYGGNIAASFAVYFLARRVTDRFGRPRASAAALAFTAVQSFEVLDGFGLMTSVYDHLDLAANTAGIILAIALDTIIELAGGGRPARLASQTANPARHEPSGEPSQPTGGGRGSLHPHDC